MSEENPEEITPADIIEEIPAASTEAAPPIAVPVLAEGREGVDYQAKYEALLAVVEKTVDAYRTYGAGSATGDSLLKLVAFVGKLQVNTAPPFMDKGSGKPTAQNTRE